MYIKQFKIMIDLKCTYFKSESVWLKCLNASSWPYGTVHINLILCLLVVTSYAQ